MQDLNQVRLGDTSSQLQEILDFGLCFTNANSTLLKNQKWTLDLFLGGDLDPPPKFTWLELEMRKNSAYEVTAWTKANKQDDVDPFTFGYKQFESTATLSVNKAINLEYEIQVRRVEIAQLDGSSQAINYASLVLVSIIQEGRNFNTSSPILSVTIGLNKLATVSKFTQKGKSLWMILFDTLSSVGGFSTSIIPFFCAFEVLLTQDFLTAQLTKKLFRTPKIADSNALRQRASAGIEHCVFDETTYQLLN